MSYARSFWHKHTGVSMCFSASVVFLIVCGLLYNPWSMQHLWGSCCILGLRMYAGSDLPVARGLPCSGKNLAKQ